MGTSLHTVSEERRRVARPGTRHSMARGISPRRHQGARKETWACVYRQEGPITVPLEGASRSVVRGDKQKSWDEGAQPRGRTAGRNWSFIPHRSLGTLLARVCESQDLAVPPSSSFPPAVPAGRARAEAAAVKEDVESGAAGLGDRRHSWPREVADAPRCQLVRAAYG